MAKTIRKKLIDALDEICSKIVYIRDGGKCQRCGKVVSGSDAHTSHVIPRSRGHFLRWCLLNLKLLCFHCHINFWHKSPTESGKWFAERFPARDEYLTERAHTQVKFTNADLEKMLSKRKQKYQELLNELKGGE
ncbi:MAG: HNH endonuclease [Planctomycetota bacterium]|jgi:hypothetical protein